MESKVRMNAVKSPALTRSTRKWKSERAVFRAWSYSGPVRYQSQHDAQSRTNIGHQTADAETMKAILLTSVILAIWASIKLPLMAQPMCDDGGIWANE